MMRPPVERTDSGSMPLFHPVVRQWLEDTFGGPTLAQSQAWPAIASGQHTLLLAPTGAGKTLAAFLWSIDRLMFADREGEAGCRVLYISPLKALGVDVERNLRVPLAGIGALARELGVRHRQLRIGIRTGDTPARERVQQSREPPEILITTPESLYLVLTSRARAMLRTVETVIIDEIHALAAGKRGSHLFLSLERLEDLRHRNADGNSCTQRIGLSATQRPLTEISRLLGGWSSGAGDALLPRHVEVVDVGQRKAFDLRVEFPDDSGSGSGASCAGSRGPERPSAWPAIHRRLVEIIRSHRSTMVFVNSRRLAERMAAAINELADEELALAHHGSLARDVRSTIEDRLKSGALRALVATSSMELGVDMGAVDIVVQIEAPPSVASGMQRIGRSGHRAGERSAGVIVPRYRGDLLPCAAAATRMIEGLVEETRYPRLPLDVLAQQIVAMVAVEPVNVLELWRTVRRAAPFSELTLFMLESVLDLLSGRYPSDEFAELAPRINWDRLTGRLEPRRGAHRLAIANAGTIPDRGLYGVFLAEEGGDSSRRVGELDEEMVFESRPGDVFLLGASSWRILDITHDRVIVTPAPGEPGRMPFWRGDGRGRPREFGLAIGALARRISTLERCDAETELVTRHCLEPRAARMLVDYLQEQRAATGVTPSDETLIVERFLDEVGDWRILLLSPNGARVHAPWALAVCRKLRARGYGDIDVMWSDDGIVFRVPEGRAPPDLSDLCPAAREIDELVLECLAETSIFAARFRENASRALLLPRRTPGRRSPLWIQRRRAADLLQVARRYERFPMILETYRECLRDFFDLDGLRALLLDVEQRRVDVRMVENTRPSPFALSLLFDYVASFIYQGDAPLAEKRAQALALDHGQLRELLGDAELRELLDPEAVAELADTLQHRGVGHRPDHPDALHDLLRRLGDLSVTEIEERCAREDVDTGRAAGWIERLIETRRIVRVRVAGVERLAAAEDAARLRDALGVEVPPLLPAAFLEPVPDALPDLVARFARTHTPFSAEAVSLRLGATLAAVNQALASLAASGRVVQGEFLPGGHGLEWCDADVLRTLKRRSLIRLRQQAQAVDVRTFAQFVARWQGIPQRHSGPEGLLDVIAQLQGVAIAASELDTLVLPARVRDYRASELDQLCATGAVIWRGLEAMGVRDGKIALYLCDHYERIAPLPVTVDGDLPARIRSLLATRGALFFDDMLRALGVFPRDLLDAVWALVWAGEVSNDTLVPLRSMVRGTSLADRRRRLRPGHRVRRAPGLPGSEGRWSLLPAIAASVLTPTERLTSVAVQLLERYGVLSRESVATENLPGGFAALYAVLTAMEERGRVRRGYFVAGLGAAQFALPGAEDQLREMRDIPGVGTLILAATDPANVYGAAVPWPERPDDSARAQRTVGARAILRDGELLGVMGKGGQSLVSFLPQPLEERDSAARALAVALTRAVAEGGGPILLTRIDGQDAVTAPLADALRAVGFSATRRGLLCRAEMATTRPASGAPGARRSRRLRTHAMRVRDFTGGE